MANLENLTRKILEDANRAANEILEKAKIEEEKIINDKMIEAEKKKKEIIERSQMEAVIRRERILSNAQLSIRNLKLEAKQAVIEDVFNEALISLQNLGEDEYFTFINNYILALKIDGDEEVIVGKTESKITPQLIEKLNANLILNGKKGELKLSDEKRHFNGGFILNKNGIETNCTFESILISKKDELEFEVFKILFQ